MIEQLENPSAVNTPAPSAPIGERLREARVARQLSVSDCAHALHLPVNLLARLEANDFGAAEHYVFLRGALKGYARLLGLPEHACDDTLRSLEPARPPSLLSVTHTAPMRWSLQRYTTAATYIALTAVIAVPLVWLGLHGGLERAPARIVSLEHAPQAEVSPQPTDAAAAPTAATDGAPIRASMAPFGALAASGATDKATAPVREPNPDSAPAGPHTLTISATGDCWFEILAADSSVVERGQLAAGDVRSWHAAGPLQVTLGNAAAVHVQSDGKPFDLTDRQRANVARFDLYGSSAGAENR